MLGATLVLFSLLATPLWAQKPTVEPPLVPSVIGFPVFEGPTTPPPLPVPQPAAGVPKLTGSLLFVFDADVECLVLCSPASVVNVTPEPGPVKYHGRFIEDPSKVQTKAFNRKFVYKVEPAQAGRCELAVIVSDGGKPVVLKRQTIDVVAGDPVDPQPDDTTVPSLLKAAYANEHSTLKRSYAQMLAGFYRTRAAQYAGSNSTQNWGEFAQDMLKGRQGLLDNEIPLVRKALEQNFFHTWPNDANRKFDKQVALDSLNAAASALEKLR